MSLTPDSASVKATTEHKEQIASEGNGDDKKLERRTMRKVDARLILILSALYSISLIDRTNIAVARLAGMAFDLNLFVGNRYSIITLAFFPPYIIFELPSNLLLRKIGCRNHLSAIVVLWGGSVLGMAFVQTWEQLVACRVLLGLLEAGFYPACIYLISCWYTRFEIQKRLAFFFLFSLVAAGFSSALSYAISLLGGTYGLAPWRWIFLIWGCATIGLGLIAFFLIVDFPDKNTFLTSEQTQFIKDKINLDRGDAEPDKMTLRKIFAHLCDLKIWAFGFIALCITVPAYAFSYFLPVILAGGGFNIRDTLLLIAPPYVFSALYILPIAYAADHYQKRAVFLAGNAVLCAVGCAIMGFTRSIGVRYFGVFIAIAGCQGNLPGVIAWQANCIVSHSKRAVSSAVVIGMGGVGGIIASLIYQQKDAPKYIPGISATIGLQGVVIVIVIVLSMHLKRENDKADAGRAIGEGDPNFRYTI